MIDSYWNQHERRLIVLAPTHKDGDITRSILGEAGIPSICCTSLEQVCAELEKGAGALLLAEEVVASSGAYRLTGWLARQPAWSDLPILVLARPGVDSEAVSQAVDLLGNVTVLERPTRVCSLVSAVRSALRARQHQFQIREQVHELERSVRTHSLLAAIVECSDDAIFSKSLDGRILSWNAGAERLFGYSAEEAIGQPIDALLVPAERQAEEAELLERLRYGVGTEHIETVRLTKSGRRLDVSQSVSPVRDHHGKVIAASTVARDITQRKQAEEALRDADRRKDEFLAMLAHELRNPLAPIRNSLNIMGMLDHQDSNLQRLTAMMERQVNHMVRLVDDLLEISRITRGKIELQLEIVEVATLVRNALETSSPLIEAAGHQVSVSIPPEPLLVSGDAVRLTQVLGNILNNAAKYTDAGGQIQVAIRHDGHDAVISIRDNGAGIPHQMLSRVFDLFTQVDRHKGRAQGGLGIGLTLVKSLVEMHHGSVTAFSEGPGMGSEFVVRLPLADSPVASKLSNSRGGATAVLAERRVMVVDDNRDSADSLGMLLKLLGAQVQVRYNGPDALEAIKTFRPAAILLDIGMPGMNGHEVARQIRQQPEFNDVMLVALTGWGQEEDRHRSQEAGFDHHLTKPADVDAVQSLLLSLDHSPLNSIPR